MSRPIRRFGIALFAFACCAIVAAVCTPDPSSYARSHPSTAAVEPAPRVEPIVLALHPQTEYLGSLAWDGAQDFLLAPAPGQYIELVAQQEGVDVVLELYRPDGSLETRVDSPNRRQGPEPLPLIGSPAGPYRLTVRGGDRSPIIGQYRLQVHAARPASDRDQKRVEADRAFAIAEGLRRQRTAASLAEAPKHYERALKLVRELGDEWREADVLLGWGVADLGREEFAPARQSLEEALVLYSRINLTREVAVARNWLGTLWLQAGEAKRAIPLLENSLRQFELERNDEDAARAHYSLGLAHRDAGDIELAIRHCLEALSSSRRLEDILGEGLGLAALGSIQSDRGLFTEAQDTFEQALTLLQSVGSPGDQAIALLGLGWVRFLEDKRSDGLSLLGEALLAARSAGTKRNLAVALYTLGVAVELSGDPRSAARHSLEAASLFAEIGWRESEALSLSSLGHALLKTGDLSGARHRFEQALALSAENQSPLARSSGHYGLALVFQEQGNLHKAVEQMERALDAHEVHRRESFNPTLRASSFAFQHPTYTAHIDLLMKLAAVEPGRRHTEEAFEAAERSRARGLLDDLGLPPASLRTAADKLLRLHEANLTTTINDVAVRRDALLGSKASSSELAQLNRQARALLAELAHLEGEFRSGSRDPLLGAAASPLPLPQLRAELLDRDSALLEYSLGEKKSYLWLLTDHSTESFVLPARAEIEERARTLHDALSDLRNPLNAQEVRSNLTWLSDTLLGQVLPLLSRRKLFIIPDGSLFLVPFSALPVSRRSSGQASPANEPQPLGQLHDLVYSPSASALVYLKRRGRTCRLDCSELAAIGDPVYGKGTTDLPAVSQELREIRSLFDRRLTLSVSGPAASKTNLLSMDLSRFRFIHFASHAAFDSDFPELSAILLSTSAINGAPLDGAVRSFELRKLNLNSELVVVSGCNTGQGKSLRGEGAVGLVNSLLSAGAQQVLVSLWSVDDRATAELMKRFYGNLTVGGQPSHVALANAQRAVAESRGWADPYYWAGFVLCGAGKHIKGTD